MLCNKDLQSWLMDYIKLLSKGSVVFSCLQLCACPIFTFFLSMLEYHVFINQNEKTNGEQG